MLVDRYFTIFRVIMRLIKRPLFPAVLLWVAIFLPSCSGFEDIDVGDIEDIKISRITTRAVDFDVILTIDNPTAFRYRITDVNLDVSINNESVGNIRNAENVMIPSRSSELYTFPLQAEFSNILRGALSVYNFFLDRNAEVTVTGTIKVRSFPFSRTIPVDETSRVNLDRR